MKLPLPILLGASLLWLSTLSACKAWKPYVPTAAPADAVTPLPDPVRVSLNNGDDLVLGQPVLESDSALVGIGGDGEMRRVPLRQVLGIESRQHQIGGTVLLGLLLAVPTFYFITLGWPG